MLAKKVARACSIRATVLHLTSHGKRTLPYEFLDKLLFRREAVQTSTVLCAHSSASWAEMTVEMIPTAPMHNVSIHTASLLPIGTSPFTRFQLYCGLHVLR